MTRCASKPARALARAGLVILAMGLIHAVAASASQAQTGIPDDSLTIRLVDAPTERRDDPRAQVYIVDHLGPGATIERRIELTNTTSEKLPIELFVGGASIEDGVWTPSQGREPTELSSWVEIEPAAIALAPDTPTIATVTIRVPGEITDGERYGVIWAAPQAVEQGNVDVVNRVGIRVYLSVGEGAEPITDFVVDSLTAARDDAGRPVVRARVENIGGRAVDLRGELMLGDGPGGASAGPFAAEVGTTLGPGDAAPVTVLLDPQLPDGPWFATVTMHSGRVTRAAEGTITFPSQPGDAADPVTLSPIEQQRAFLIPLASILFLVSLLAVLLVWFARRRRDDEDEVAVADEAASQQPTTTGW